MKDILKKYSKHKKLSNLAAIVTSLVLAIGINIIVLDDSDLGASMKANVLEVKQQNETADVYGSFGETALEIFTNKHISDVKNISFSFSYNPENVSIHNVYSQIAEVIELSNENGLYSVILNLDVEKNITKASKLLSIEFEKQSQGSEQLNIFNVNFTDKNGEIYILSSSGITF